MNDFIYDIETYPNVFCMTVKSAADQTRWVFEISHRRDDLPAIIQLVRWFQYIKARMVGFNNLSFDYPVLHAILTANSSLTALQIYQFANQIITSQKFNKFAFLIWDRDQVIPQMDLFKIYNFDNPATATSLKIIEFNMRSSNVQELPFPPGMYLTDEQINFLIEYNGHDVNQTELFYLKSLEAIKFREELSTKYERNFLNCSDAKIGENYFIMELEKQLPGSCYEQGPDGKRKPRQTPRDAIALNDVILPWIKFKRPEFIRTHEWLMTKIITDTKGFFKKPKKKRGTDGSEDDHYEDDVLDKRMPPCIINKFSFVFGTGGIHGSVKNKIIYSTDTHVVIDIDVKSFYPNIAIANRLYPQHLSLKFCDIYKDVYEQRKQYDKSNPINGMLKLALNATYGKSNSIYSPFYDPQYTMAITINGQLLICLLADYLMDIPGLEMIQVNTDGLTIRIPRAAEDAVKRVTDWWQAHTCLELESVTYNRMFIRDGNSYIGEDEKGKLKRKGAYEYTLKWHQNHSALVIPMAAEAALVRGVPVRQFITSHENIYDFMLRTKVPRSSKLMWVTEAWGDVQLQNICRYYVSITGGSLVKVMPPLAKNPEKERRIGIAVGWQVTECNNIAQADRRTINYEYYIQEAEKLVTPLL